MNMITGREDSQLSVKSKPQGGEGVRILHLSQSFIFVKDEGLCLWLLNSVHIIDLQLNVQSAGQYSC
jgi:hypothetical protein